MANAWFRMYAEFSTDPKVQMMSEQMQRRLVMLFCLRCNGDTKNLSDEEIAFSLRIGVVELSETKKMFIQKGFINESWSILKWDERQFLSDDSKERVKKHRAHKKSMGLTANGYTKHTVTVTQRDNGKCIYCESEKNLCIDHILPVCQGGNDDIENLGLACKECNSGKAGRTPEQARYSFKNKQREIEWNTWLNNRVTVTVTPPDTEQNRTDTEQKEVEVFAVTSEPKNKTESLKTKKATRLPADWELPQEWGDWAETQGLTGQEIIFQAEKFKDWWVSKAGAGGVKADWQATWRNWIRNYLERKSNDIQAKRYN